MSSSGSVECSTAQTSPSSSWKSKKLHHSNHPANPAANSADSAALSNDDNSPLTNDNNNNNAALSFSKKNCFPRKQTSAFSSFTSSSASSSAESTPVASVTANSVLSDDHHTRIQTPAALAAAATALSRRSQTASVQIGDKLPFQEQPPVAARAATVTKSHSTVSLAARRKYEPAQAVVRTSPDQHSHTTSHPKPFELSFKSDQYRSEEELRQAAARRCNYSLPTSPTGGHYSWMVMPKQVGCAPKTPLYVPAVLRRNGCGAEDEPHDGDYFGYPGSGASTAASSGTVSPVNGSAIPKSHWRPDSSRHECAACRRPFTLFERRHHCRRCGDIFCRDDSKFTVELDPSLSFNPLGGFKVRACCNCAAEYQEFKKSLVCPLPQLNPATPETITAVRQAQTSDPVGSVPADWQWSTF